MISVKLKISITCILLCIVTVVTMATNNVGTKEDMDDLQILNNLRFKLQFLEKDHSPEEILQTLSRLSVEWPYEKDKAVAGDIYCMRIGCYILQGDYGWALNEVNKILEVADNPSRLSYSFYALGEIYYSLNLYEKAIPNYLLAREYFQKMGGMSQYLTAVNLKLLFIYLSLQQRANAQKELYELQENIAKLDSSARPPSIWIKYAQASFYIIMEDFIKSRQLIDELETSNDSIYNPYGIVSNMINTNYHLRKGELDEAYRYIQKCLNASDNLYDIHWYVHALTKRAKIKALMNDMQGACEDYRVVYHLKDSLMNNNFIRQDNTLHLNYQVDDDATLKWKERQQTLYMSIICIGILLITGVGLMIRYNKKNEKLKNLRVKLNDARKKIDENIQAKSVFLSNMSHEIRTPLNAISGFSELLVSQENLDIELRKQCNEMIQQNSKLLMKLLNDVLDLSNLDIQKMSFKFKECNVVPLCRTIVETVKGIKRTEAEVSFNTSLRELYLFTDENRLQQMLLNILVNATKFTKSGSIILSLETKKDGMAYFSVTDTGIGISPEMRYKVFSRFEKLDENSYGYGLGLSICKLIVTRLGGKIWVDSEYNDGARFIFTHPIKWRINK